MMSFLFNVSFRHANAKLRISCLPQESKSSGRSSMSRCRNSVSTTTSDDQPHIGNYRLLKTIGKGNFAKVKLARHVLTGKEVSQRVWSHFKLSFSLLGGQILEKISSFAFVLRESFITKA